MLCFIILLKLKDKLLIWRLESSISSSKYFVPFQVLGMLQPTKSENRSTSAKQSCQSFCSAYFSTGDWCFPVYFEKFIRTPFLQNTSARLLLLWVDLINHVRCTINIWGTQTHIWRLFHEIFESSHWGRWW